MTRLLCLLLLPLLVAGCNGQRLLFGTDDPLDAPPGAAPLPAVPVPALSQAEQLERIDRIYRGEGLPGQLIRVTLRQGTLLIDGQPRPFQTVRELLAEGERKAVVVLEANARRPRTSRLTLSFEQGTLYLDGGRDLGNIGYPYRPNWDEGERFDSVDTLGPARLRDVELTVESIPTTPSRWPPLPRQWQ